MALIAIFLLAPIEASDYTVVDVSYWGRTNTSVFIQTVYDYNNKSDIEKFPVQLGKWKGSDFNYSEEVYELLEADIMLSRAYRSGGDVIWIDIINSKLPKSFHDPKICYSCGWNLTSESIEALHIAGNRSYLAYTNMYVNKLEIQKLGSNESQVVLYWFMFKPSKEYGVTMVRLSGRVINSTAKTYAYMKEFVEKELFDAMYDRVAIQTRTYGGEIIATNGGWGALGIGVLFLIPLAMLFPGVLKNIIIKII